jgi:hypothetical protein
MQNPAKAPIGQIVTVFEIETPAVHRKFKKYVSSFYINDANITDVFHGTRVNCDLCATQSFCSDTGCAICSICRNGFDVGLAATAISFTRFGKGVYFAPHSSKSHDYTRGAPGTEVRMMLLCQVAKGKSHNTTSDLTSLTSPPSGLQAVKTFIFVDC